MPSDYVPLGYRVRVDVWVPLPTEVERTSRTTDLFVTARLGPTITVEQASAEVRQLAQAAYELFPGSNSLQNVERANVVGLRASFVGDRERNALRILLAGVALVVLIASANVANLLLVRASARERELAMRVALGANRWRVARQLLTESVVLGLAGGGVGLVAAVTTLSALSRSLPSHMPRASEVSIDVTVLLFTLGVSLGSSLLAGLAPVLRVVRLEVESALRDRSRTTSGVSRYRLNRSLLTLEIGFSMVLVIGAGLMLKSRWLMSQVDLGLDTDQVVTMCVAPPAGTYDSASRRGRFYESAREKVRRVPGVGAVSIIQKIPMAIGRASRVRYVPEGAPPDPEAPYVAALRLTKGDHFQTFGIPLMRGRTFASEHATSVELAVVIDESLERAAWPDGHAVGKTIRILDDELTARVIGVVGAVLSRVDGDAQPMIYMDLDQWNGIALPRMEQAGVPESVLAWSRAQSLSVYLNFRTAGALGTIDATRAAIRSLDEDVAIVDVRTMDQVVNEGVAAPRFFALLMSIFGALALALGAIGVYGLLSYMVSQRTHEIGVRMALGARQVSVVRAVLAQGLGPVVLGIAMGSLGALLVSGILSSLLFGVARFDPLTYVVVVVVLLVAALVASLLPARRATRVDPIVALSSEQTSRSAEAAWREAQRDTRISLWPDGYSNLFQVLAFQVRLRTRQGYGARRPPLLDQSFPRSRPRAVSRAPKMSARAGQWACRVCNIRSVARPSCTQD